MALDINGISYMDFRSWCDTGTDSALGESVCSNRGWVWQGVGGSACYVMGSLGQVF